MSTPTLKKLPNVVHWGNSRYAVMLDDKEIGLLSKDEDSFSSKHQWKAFARAEYPRVYIGSFESWHDAATAVHQAHLTKTKNQTKE